MSTSPSGLATQGHEVRIRADWELECSCGKRFKRNEKTRLVDAAIRSAKQHLRSRTPEAIAARAKAKAEHDERVEKKRLALKAEADALWATRHFNGSKTTRDLSKAWRLSSAATIRYLKACGKVRGVRREVQPYRYDWTVVKED